MRQGDAETDVAVSASPCLLVSLSAFSLALRRLPELRVGRGRVAGARTTVARHPRGAPTEPVPQRGARQRVASPETERIVENSAGKSRGVHQPARGGVG